MLVYSAVFCQQAGHAAVCIYGQDMLNKRTALLRRLNYQLVRKNGIQVIGIKQVTIVLAHVKGNITAFRKEAVKGKINIIVINNYCQLMAQMGFYGFLKGFAACRAALKKLYIRGKNGGKFFGETVFLHQLGQCFIAVQQMLTQDKVQLVFGGKSGPYKIRRAALFSRKGKVGA